MYFDFNKYKGNYVMHCKTIEEAESFCKAMHKNKMRWASKTTYISHNNWDVHRERTCYNFNNSACADADFYKEYFKILEWSDFMDKGETKMNRNNNTLLPKDVDNVIFNGGNTVVTLTNGRKGVSKCDETDEFDPYTGYSLAYYKAKHDKNFELKRMFNGCIEYSKKKDYKQTIIKNK